MTNTMTAGEVRFLEGFAAAKRRLFNESLSRESLSRESLLKDSLFEEIGQATSPDTTKYVACRVLRTLDEPIPLDPLYSLLLHVQSH